MDAIELAWKEYAEACTCHNVELGHHALAELIPRQREIDDDERERRTTP